MLDLGVDDLIDEMVAEYRKKIKQAVKMAQDVAIKKIENEVIPKMTDKYYGEYFPKYYLRQYQLGKSVGLYTAFKESNNIFSLKLGVEDENPYGGSAMFHKGKTVDNDIIFANFLDGIHPNVPKLHENLQGTNTVEYANELLDELIEEELIPLIDSLI